MENTVKKPKRKSDREIAAERRLKIQAQADEIAQLKAQLELKAEVDAKGFIDVASDVGTLRPQATKANAVYEEPPPLPDVYGYDPNDPDWVYSVVDMSDPETRVMLQRVYNEMRQQGWQVTETQWLSRDQSQGGLPDVVQMRLPRKKYDEIKQAGIDGYMRQLSPVQQSAGGMHIETKTFTDPHERPISADEIMAGVLRD